MGDFRPLPSKASEITITEDQSLSMWSNTFTEIYLHNKTIYGSIFQANESEIPLLHEYNGITKETSASLEVSML